jgi:hypothetical protein
LLYVTEGKHVVDSISSALAVPEIMDNENKELLKRSQELINEAKRLNQSSQSLIHIIRIVSDKIDYIATESIENQDNIKEQRQ